MRQDFEGRAQAVVTLACYDCLIASPGEPRLKKILANGSLQASGEPYAL
jgi:hypothetical protein